MDGMQPNSSMRYGDAPSEWNALSAAVIGAAMDVHTALGAGLLERLYEQALCHELGLRGVPFEKQRPVRISYKGAEIGDQYLDLVVGNVVVVELKSVERVLDVHLAQLVSYMRSAQLPLGLLINFNTTHLRHGIHRRLLSSQTPAPPAFLSNPPPSSSAPSDPPRSL